MAWLGGFVTKTYPLLEPESNAAFAEVIRRHFDIDAVTSKHPNAVFSHLATRMSKYLVIIVEFDAKHRVWQQFCYRS